jgi:ABC-type branched-subunit amino acid transport system substrate-binding protein
VTEGKSFTFQTCFDDRRQAKHLATYIVKEKQRKRIAVLFNRSHAFSIGFADETKRAIGQEFEGSSAKVVLARGFGALEEIDDQVINELRVQEVDAVVIPSYQVEAANLLSRLSSSLGDKVLYFGPDSWGGGKIFHAAFRNDLGAGPRAFYVEHWAKESSDIKTKKFLKDYSRFQPKNPSLRADTTSDLGPVVAFYELVQFFYSVWRTPPGRELSLKIREARFQGPRGAVSYRSGNAPEKAIHLFAIGRGVEKYLGPYGSAGDSK